jgi:hypothetical protein
MSVVACSPANEFGGNFEKPTPPTRYCCTAPVATSKISFRLGENCRPVRDF